MSKLIKNELFKMLHKPTIYVLIILPIIFFSYLTFANYTTTTEESYKNSIEKSIEFYKIEQNDTTNTEYYVDYKTKIDTGILKLKYNKNSSEEYFIDTTITPILEDMYSAKYISKDTELFDVYNDNYNKSLQKLNNYNWREPIETKISELRQLIEIKENEEKTEYQEKQLEILYGKLNVLYYRIEHNIPYSYTKASKDLEEYSSLLENYVYIKDSKDNSLNYSEMTNIRNIEKNFNTLKYKIDNNIIQNTKAYNTEISVSEELISKVDDADLFLVIFCVIISSQIISNEFEKGTIKKLLTKPFSRSKILTSKIIATLLIFIGYAILYLIILLLITGIFGGFSNIGIPQVEYDFNSNQAFEMNIVINVLVHFLASIPIYLFLIIFTLCISIVAPVTTLPMGLGFLIFISSYFTQEIYKRSLAMIPTNCWNFNCFLFGGSSQNMYISLKQSIFVLVIWIGILLFIGYTNFKHKEIKNQ